MGGGRDSGIEDISGRLQYRVSWRGCDPDPEYYNARNFKNSARPIKAFHERYPDQPGPPKRLDHWLQAADAEEFDPDHDNDNVPARKGI